MVLFPLYWNLFLKAIKYNTLILVTGASGFLGQHLLELLIQQPTPIRALYNSTQPTITAPNLEWVQCDLLDVYAIEEVMQGVTQVYHCAAIVSFDAKKKDQLIHDNVAITENIVNIALEQNIQKLIHVSSIASLGRAELDKPIAEDTYWTESKENSSYSKSKHYAEMHVWRGIAEGLNAAILNPGIILGEGNWNTGSSQLMTNVASGFPYYTEGVNAWVDVKDVARAMVLLMESDVENERYILSCGNFSYEEIFKTMANALGIKPPHKKASAWMSELVWRMDTIKSKLTGKNALITKESARTAQAKCYYDNSKFLKTFEDFTYTSLPDTIKRMAMAFKKDA